MRIELIAVDPLIGICPRRGRGGAGYLLSFPNPPRAEPVPTVPVMTNPLEGPSFEIPIACIQPPFPPKVARNWLLSWVSAKLRNLPQRARSPNMLLRRLFLTLAASHSLSVYCPPLFMRCTMWVHKRRGYCRLDPLAPRPPLPRRRPGSYHELLGVWILVSLEVSTDKLPFNEIEK